MTRGNLILAGLIGFVVLLFSSMFVVKETERALVLQFGQVKAVKDAPGLAFKLPFIQNVVKYDDRIQSLDTDREEITPADDRRLMVDGFARWRISDVVQFRQAVAGGGIDLAEQRLRRIINASLKEVLGEVTSGQILSADRIELMNQIRDAARVAAQNLGVEIVDVRIKRADLPDQNLKATFDRMKAEREREATDERARGAEAALKVRAAADRTAVELVSEARRDSDIIRGEADADRNRIFAEAFGKDAEFFEFYRSLTAYERALRGNNSQIILSPDSEFFNYLGNSEGRKAE